MLIIYTSETRYTNGIRITVRENFSDYDMRRNIPLNHKKGKPFIVNFDLAQSELENHLQALRTYCKAKTHSAAYWAAEHYCAGQYRWHKLDAARNVFEAGEQYQPPSV